jgi:hypothetical protein
MDIEGRPTHIGGVAGYILGAGSVSQVAIEDCVYETGEIKGYSARYLFLGGIAGYVEKYARFRHCYSRAGRTEAKANTTPGENLLYGGFAGYLTAIDISDCGSSSPMTLTGRPAGSARVGGFVGEIEDTSGGVAKLEKCWAEGDINVADAGDDLAVGGLIGESWGHNASSPNLISQCYATGNVNAVSSATYSYAVSAGGLAGLALSTRISECWSLGAVYARRTLGYRIYAGGLVGVLGDYTYGSVGGSGDPDLTNSSIENCYALGDVLADKATNSTSSSNSYNYPLYAGGLVGYVRIKSPNEIRRSFAVGSVAAHSQDASHYTYAGGIIGRMDTGGTLSNTVAFGAKIVATGGGTLGAARVYGSSAGTSANNYALNSMLTGTSPSYDGYVPGSTQSSSSSNGTDVGSGTVKSQAFWIATNPGFSSSCWDFSYLAIRGYPKLKNVGGQ